MIFQFGKAEIEEEVVGPASGAIVFRSNRDLRSVISINTIMATRGTGCSLTKSCREPFR